MAGRPPRGLLHKTLHTFSTLLFGQGATIAAGIAVAHTFGPSGRGVLGFAAVLVTFAFTTGDGIRNAIAYQIGKQQRNAWATWHTALRTLAFAAPAGCVALLAAALLVPSQPAYRFAALAFPFALYVHVLGVVYLLADRVESINVKNAATFGGGGSLLTLALVLLHANVTVVLAGWAATYAVAAVWASFGLGSLLGERREPATGAMLREQAAFAAKSALTSNVTFLALRVDVLIVSALATPAALGLYTLALATGEIMWNVSRALFWASSGRVATLALDASAALTARVVRLTVLAQLAGCVALFVAGPTLVTLVYGARFAESGTVLRVLLPGMLFYSADGVLSYFIAVRAGKPTLLLGLETITFALCATVTFVTLPHDGIVGAAAADTVAYLAAFALKTLVFARLSGLSPFAILRPRRDDLPYRVRRRLGPYFAARPDA
jgi:O-antigen/teichoic acid export membrane protein